MAKSSESNLLVLPRPWAAANPRAPIPAPSEERFTRTFGRLLPPAQHLETLHGRVAYYELPRLTSPTAEASSTMTPGVLFIHGVQTPALGLLPLAKKLRETAASARFVLIDLYGHGLSDTPCVAHTPELFYALIDSLLAQIGWPSAHLVGFSFGGQTAVGYAARHPDRVQSLALVAPAGLYRSSDFNAEHLRGDNEVLAQAWVMELLEGGQLVVPPDWKERIERGEVVAEALREWQMREHEGHAASVVAMFRDGGVMDSREKFAAVGRTGIPSIVVLGELDDIGTPQHFGQLGFDNVAVVPRAKHTVVRDNVPEVAGHIAHFWTGLTAAADRQ